ncbi:hypothetical protein SAMN05192568_102715 [Methylobacterium pseudosasicola]|uniref:Uncharacterized protein n=1 Tax=Methylobacterium pseudosasicola TaxID=582667 RepID=A0A1I4PXK0_9HYPH|nr:hypothetical protein SAMN05192568_102715 [Methylobacterium pseudosasicola]
MPASMTACRHAGRDDPDASPLPRVGGSGLQGRSTSAAWASPIRFPRRPAIRRGFEPLRQHAFTPGAAGQDLPDKPDPAPRPTAPNLPSGRVGLGPRVQPTSRAAAAAGPVPCRGTANRLCCVSRVRAWLRRPARAAQAGWACAGPGCARRNGASPDARAAPDRRGRSRTVVSPHGRSRPDGAAFRDPGEERATGRFTRNGTSRTSPRRYDA